MHAAAWPSARARVLRPPAAGVGWLFVLHHRCPARRRSGCFFDRNGGGAAAELWRHTTGRRRSATAGHGRAGMWGCDLAGAIRRWRFDRVVGGGGAASACFLAFSTCASHQSVCACARVLASTGLDLRCCCGCPGVLAACSAAVIANSCYFDYHCGSLLHLRESVYKQ